MSIAKDMEPPPLTPLIISIWHIPRLLPFLVCYRHDSKHQRTHLLRTYLHKGANTFTQLKWKHGCSSRGKLCCLPWSSSFVALSRFQDLFSHPIGKELPHESSNLTGGSNMYLISDLPCDLIYFIKSSVLNMGTKLPHDHPSHVI